MDFTVNAVVNGVFAKSYVPQKLSFADIFIDLRHFAKMSRLFSTPYIMINPQNIYLITCDWISSTQNLGW